ncbi:C1 family peptidase [Flavobacterium lindanitolerans]|jgi:bleomycin hydrolase|uniref:C1 family peptidase n=1 Tax=Flavobacterium lindanitolerans TaxID=428988 RepID=UPI00280752B5|nr:C1 family peptidase [Flavobacterium lindanitolerans]MDQ7960288.1 C1 family peptidase [Flavobacterium lindanitolerans]
MRQTFLPIALLAFAFSAYSQKYEFQTIKDIEATPVISQDITGTCWSFSSTSFLEAEIIRTTGRKIDLSEMYNVRNTYPKKAWNYVMRQGKAQFGEGGLNHDVINSAMQFGLVPLTAYSGLVGNATKHDHSKMVKELEDLLKKYADPSKKLDPKWKTEVEAILDKYMGANVTEFTYDGKKYTPKSFLEMTKLNLKDYVTITSFTNEPYYKTFILDIPDNFSNGSFYNMPLDEFVQNVDNALDKGYTLALDADVSEKTFSGKNGIAVIPENEADEKTILTEIKPEKNITPEFRQQEFENFNTTDDHLMHIVGKVKDQKGNIYYKVKNSWGSKNLGNDGYIYMSVPYLRLKAISVLLHKDGLLKKTKKELGV